MTDGAAELLISWQVIVITCNGSDSRMYKVGQIGWYTIIKLMAADLADVCKWNKKMLCTLQFFV
jgi:hypothetical protein